MWQSIRSDQVKGRRDDLLYMQAAANTTIPILPMALHCGRGDARDGVLSSHPDSVSHTDGSPSGEQWVWAVPSSCDHLVRRKFKIVMERRG